VYIIQFPNIQFISSSFFPIHLLYSSENGTEEGPANDAPKDAEEPKRESVYIYFLTTDDAAFFFFSFSGLVFVTIFFAGFSY